MSGHIHQTRALAKMPVIPKIILNYYGITLLANGT
jgi:hypothetical protein